MEESNLNIIVKRLGEVDKDVQRMAIERLKETVRGAQGGSFQELEELLNLRSEILKGCERLEEGDRRRVYDIVSVISIIDSLESVLKYRVMGNITDLREWSHQYVRKLATAIAEVVSGSIEWIDYKGVIEGVLNFLFRHNGETEGIDLAIEVSGLRPIKMLNDKNSTFAAEIKSVLESEREEVMEKEENCAEFDEKRYIINALDYIKQNFEICNRNRALLYLEELSRFYDLEDLIIELTKYDVTRHLITLIRYRRVNDAVSFVRSIKDNAVKKQCLYILARNSIRYNGNDFENGIMTNSHMKRIFKRVAESLEVTEPKKIDGMFKGLSRERADVTAIANGLVHFGYKRDPLFFPQEGDYHAKEEHRDVVHSTSSISVLASVGLINAFSPESVYSLYESQIFDTSEIGAILGVALSAYRTNDPDSSILHLLNLFVASNSSQEAIAALMAVAILYSWSHRQEVYEIVFPLLSSNDNSVALFSIYVLGCVFPGDIEILSSCVEVYAELKKDPLFTNFAILGIAIFFYRLPIPENSSARQIFDSLEPHCKILARGFAALGSGDPNAVDSILTEAFVGEIDALLESLGLIASCVVAIGDSIAVKHIEHLATASLLLDSPHLKAIVPLCLAMLYPSDPRPEIIDIVERCVNSGECSVNAIIALGIIGAGSCSARIGRILDSAFTAVCRDPRASSALVYARGLLHLGKGLFTLSPLAYDRQVILPRSFVSLLSTLFLFLETWTSFKDYSFLLYNIVGAVQPRYTDTDVPSDLTLRVGRPVDTVGMAGNPSRISATVVQTLPAILNTNERAETDVPLCTAFVEDIIVPREDP